MPPPRRQFSLREAAPRWWLLLALLIGLSTYAYLGAYLGRGGGGAPARFEGRTMGTTYQVSLGRTMEGAALAALRDEVEDRFARINARMSTYDPGSELSRFNRHRSTAPFSVSAELAQVVRLALEISRVSGGAFDPTVGPLVDAWGFGPPGRRRGPVSAEELEALRPLVGYEKLRLDGDRLVKAHPDLRLDLSAIAKGYAVDEVAGLLERRGHRDFLIEIGGEVRVRGRRADGRPFRVAITDPRGPTSRGAYAALALEGALATSGNYRNQFEIDGESYVHTLDPATGRPVRHTLLSASVLHERCAVADAWATALMAAGPERAWRLAEENDLSALLLMAASGGKLVERATPGFAPRMSPFDREGK